MTEKEQAFENLLQFAAIGINSWLNEQASILRNVIKEDEDDQPSSDQQDDDQQPDIS